MIYLGNTSRLLLYYAVSILDYGPSLAGRMQYPDAKTITTIGPAASLVSSVGVRSKSMVSIGPSSSKISKPVS